MRCLRKCRGALFKKHLRVFLLTLIHSALVLRRANKVSIVSSNCSIDRLPSTFAMHQSNSREYNMWAVFYMLFGYYLRFLCAMKQETSHEGFTAIRQAFIVHGHKTPTEDISWNGHKNPSHYIYDLSQMNKWYIFGQCEFCPLWIGAPSTWR